ncbi:hypothetical protein [Rubellimicrobium sp. CFH 75288]|uniref:hypothetical protein n=1 Tax=Rubellimicrobium sp. CFH 75288 TaxID=2697034 RepID=UPI0014130554|nr:hypothetical protein [Rubellimicrobium sp. CFH 75288]NAZ37147.1 hypothetical protein [Rubellimicrobium sp. CFH 75288]
MDLDFDLPGLDTKTLSEQGVPMPVLDPAGRPALDRQGRPITITLLGPDSDRYRAAARAQLRRRIQRASAGQEPDFAEEEAEIIAILADCTLGWEGVCTPDGEPIPCTVAAAAEIYRRYPLIRDQADRFIGDRTRFTKAS